MELTDEEVEEMNHGTPCKQWCTICLRQQESPHARGRRVPQRELDRALQGGAR